MSRRPWHELREEIGSTRNRLAALQVMSAATGYKPLPHQLRAHLAGVDSGICNKLLLGGVGAGKSYWNMAECVLLAMMNPGSVGAVVSPTYDQAINVLLPLWEEMTDALARAGYPLVRRWLGSMSEAHLVCGGRVLFRSHSRVDRRRGRTLSWAALDETESSTNPTYVWDVIAGRLRDPHANVLQCHATTTPQGLRGVPAIFIQGRQAARAMKGKAQKAEELRRGYTVRAHSTTNKHLPPGYIDSLRATYSKRQWEQEVEAKILRASSAVWPEFQVETHSRPWAYDPSLPYSVAVDFGYMCPHVLWLQQATDGCWIVFAEFHEDQIPPLRLRQVIGDKCRRLGKDPEHITGDRAAPQELSYLSREYPGTYVHRMRTKDEQSKRKQIEAVRTLLDPLAGLPRLMISTKLAQSTGRRALVKCLQNYRYRTRANGEIDESQPWKDQVHDHGADALAYHVAAVAAVDDMKALNIRKHYGKRDPFRTPGRSRR